MILGLDTATAATTVAVLAPGHALERRDDPPAGARPAHAGRLLALVEETLAEAGASWEAVRRIAVGTGPGGFTGLRIGIATARALAQARDLPLVGVSSLHALAQGVKGTVPLTWPVDRHDVKGTVPLTWPVDRHGRPIVAVIDARRGEVFAAAGDALEAAALAPQDLADRIAPGSMAVGDGAVRFRSELERAGAVIPVDDSPFHRVSALQVCRLGALGDPADRDALLPDYRREPDAKPPRLP